MLAPRNRPGELAQKLLIDAYAPTSVLTDAKFEGVFYSGEVNRYFQIASGESNRNILLMAREGLKTNLRAALESARETGETASKAGAHIRRDGAAYKVRIDVRPVPGEGFFLVSLIEEPAPAKSALESPASAEEISRITQLEQDLETSRLELNATIHDLELANQDMRIVNEEALSINEEFQSTNEELETSKEELQALNEELTAVNAQLQEALEQQRATAADLQNILNSSDVATIFLDTALKIRFFTPAAQALFGVTGVDIGRPLADLAQRFRDDTLLVDARAVLTAPEPRRREIEGRDGDWYIRSVLPYRDARSTVEGIVITFARISEIKAAQRKVIVASAYAESIIATVRQPLLVLDDASRIVSANASFFKMFDVRPEESIGTPFALGGRLLKENLADFAGPIEGGNAVEDRELTIDLPKLGQRTLALSAREIEDDPQLSRRILVAIDDITDARAREAKLAEAKTEAERANLAKSRFLAAASHDLRQPLQTIAILKTMLSQALPDPATSKLIDQLDRTVRTMSSLLDKLLDINQLEAGVIEPKLTNFEINDLLQHLQSEFSIHALSEGLGMRVVPCHARVRSDPRLLEQIIRNMLSNATKYTTHGKVLLGCRRLGDRLRIEVWDTGTGIPETELSAIFNEFHQLDSGNGKRAKGLGLGLAIVKGLADLLGTPITVRSRVGRGSVFSVDVPVVQASALEPLSFNATEAAQANHRYRPTSGRQRTVFIVEDEMEVRETLKMLLDSRGYRTLTARDGAQALAIAADYAAELDLILADYNLPGHNGLDVVDQISASVGRKIPAIMLTGDISAATLLEIAGKGHLHLHKPADAEKLVRYIDEFIDTGSAEGVAPTIFIIDDDVVACGAIRDILAAHGYRSEVFADGASFLKAYSLDWTGCVIADTGLSGINALQLIERLADLGASLPVIVIAAHGRITTAVKAMQLGAFDFLDKPVVQAALLTSIERALRNASTHTQLPAEEKMIAPATKGLSARQLQILDRFLADMSSSDIATDLGMNERGVDNHLDMIMRKVGAKSLSALIRLAHAARNGHAAEPDEG